MLLRLVLVAIVAIAALALATGAARSEGVDALRLVLFSGTELGEGRAATSGGFKLAIGGDLDRPGPIVMGLANAQADVAEVGVAVGKEVEDVGVTRIDFDAPRGFASGALIGGWQWVTSGGATLTLAAGPEAATRQVEGPDGLLVWSDIEIGARVLAEVWTHPRPGWLATATFVGSSATRSLWARGAAGWRLPGPWPLSGAYVGPEVIVYADPGYREPRIGMHLTELTLGGLTLRLGGGWSLGDGEGGYLALTTHTKM